MIDSYNKLSDINFDCDKKIFLRADLNVPIINSKILDDYRIVRLAPTVKYLLNMGSKIVLASHFGRPKAIPNKNMSLKQLIPTIEKCYNVQVIFIDNIYDLKNEDIEGIKPGQIILLENLRFYPEEEENNYHFAQNLARFFEIYINDAFSCSHRAHASIEAISRLLPSYMGLLFEDELYKLSSIFQEKKDKTISIIAGSKISSKINLLISLVKKSDLLFIGGAMANNFYHSKGYNIGRSLFEPWKEDIINDIYDTAKKYGCEICLPQDVIVADDIQKPSYIKNCLPEEVSDKDIILDIGSNAIEHFKTILKNYQIIIWNGPVGAFEYSPFDKGSIKLAMLIANATQKHKIFSVSGGGDSVAVIKRAKVLDKLSYVSTAGGAFLEYIEGKTLPGLKNLRK